MKHNYENKNVNFVCIYLLFTYGLLNDTINELLRTGKEMVMFQFEVPPLHDVQISFFEILKFSDKMQITQGTKHNNLLQNNKM